MDAFRQDVRYAARGLIRSPGFTALTVFCLALGVGINSTVFSIVDNVSLRSLPFEQADRLVVLYATQPDGATERGRVSYQDYRDWKEQARSFGDLAAHAYRSLSITEGVESERFQGSAVTWNLFPLLGEHPVLGRQFTKEEDRPGAPRVVMLSHGLWQRRYAADPSIVGRTIIVDGSPHTVVGIMPPRFQFPQVSQLWVPLVPLEHASSRRERTLLPVARLAAGATIEIASGELVNVAGRLAHTHRDDEGWSARAVPLRDELMPVQLQLATTAMLGAVSLVLVIACANVANLLLARAAYRQREIAVRISLGAGRWRLVRQLLTESALLALLSAPLGLFIAYAGLESIMNAVPPTVIMPYYIDWSMNTRVVVYTTAVALVTGLLFGLAPALHAGRASLAGALKDGGRGGGPSRGRTRLRNALVVVEVALSLMLLVGASLFVRSILNIYSADAGIDTTKLMTMRVFMPGDAYSTPEAITARVDDVVHRIEALPGVTAAFASNLVPLSGGGGNSGIVGEGTTVEAGKEPRASFFAATAHALDTLGQTLVAGRDFTDTEASTRSGAALVNQALAARVWPGRSDTVGRRFRLAGAPSDEWHTVIGVVSEFQPLILRDKGIVEPLAILPFPYQAVRDTGLTVRVVGIPPASITAPARRAVGESDASLALFEMRTGDENREGRLWAPLFLSWMFSIFGAAALFLAAIGVYGVLSYSVAQRTQEFGVRMALGASRPSVLGLVMAQGARLAAVGIVVGAAGAFVVTRGVQALLYNVTPTDPISFVGTTLVLAAVTVLAGCVPAGRATSVDPNVALRSD
jgi:putative ABC transport system permease protein